MDSCLRWTLHSCLRWTLDSFVLYGMGSSSIVVLFKNVVFLLYDMVTV